MEQTFVCLSRSAVEDPSLNLKLSKTLVTFLCLRTELLAKSTKNYMLNISLPQLQQYHEKYEVMS